MKPSVPTINFDPRTKPEGLGCKELLPRSLQLTETYRPANLNQSRTSTHLDLSKPTKIASSAKLLGAPAQSMAASALQDLPHLSTQLLCGGCAGGWGYLGRFARVWGYGLQFEVPLKKQLLLTTPNYG